MNSGTIALEIHVCPQCGNTSETRPVLNTNAALAEVVKSLHHDFSPALPPQSYAGPEDMACDFCTKQHKLKAVKCCLTCDVFLCETHVKATLHNSSATETHTVRRDWRHEDETRAAPEHR